MKSDNYLFSMRISLFRIYVKYSYLDLTTVQLYSDCESYEYSFSVNRKSYDETHRRSLCKIFLEIEKKYLCSSSPLQKCLLTNNDSSVTAKFTLTFLLYINTI